MPDTTESAHAFSPDPEANPGLCERPHDLEAVADRGEPAPELPAGVFVVRVRPSRGGWRFLPPLAIIALGVSFLTFRARSSDWQGFAFNLTTPRRLTPSLPPKRAATPSPTPTPSPSPVSELARPAETVPPVPPAPAAVAGAVDASRPAPVTSPTAAPAAVPDPLEDIRREAEATRRRTEELERLKAEQGRKLEESAAEREFADRLDHPQRGRGLRRLPGNAGPDNLELIFEAHRREFRRQMERMTEIHRRQLESMAAMEREFLNGPQAPGAANGPGFGFGPRPGFGFGFGMSAPGGMMGLPDQPRGLQGFTFPPPAGNGPSMRIYRGTGVIRGGEMIWSFRPADGQDDPPPPPSPAPAPRRFKATPPPPARPDREV